MPLAAEQVDRFEVAANLVEESLEVAGTEGDVDGRSGHAAIVRGAPSRGNGARFGLASGFSLDSLPMQAPWTRARDRVTMRA